MTDLEKFIALYNEFGVELSVSHCENGTQEVVIEADCCEKIKGHIGFYTVVTFDESGQFQEQSFFE